jgi:hypothetical protein
MNIFSGTQQMSTEEELEEKRIRDRGYSKTYYNKHKEEKRRKQLESYYRMRGTQPKEWSKLAKQQTPQTS